MLNYIHILVFEKVVTTIFVGLVSYDMQKNFSCKMRKKDVFDTISHNLLYGTVCK